MYSFEPTDEQKMLVDAARRFAAELRAAGREAEEGGAFPTKLIAKGWEIGILQASIPEAFGGFGERSAVTSVLAAEELAYGDLAGALAVGTPGLFALSLLLAGSDDQRKQYLPPVIEADWKPYTTALIEPAFDFDPNDLKTTAVLDGDQYKLAGEKTLVPYAAEAEALIVFAKLDGATRGFLVPKGNYRVGEEREKFLGLNAIPFHRVVLEASVPASNLLPGDFAPVLDAMRVANSCMAVGVAKAAFEYARDYARERDVFGMKVAQKQAIAFMLAEMATEIEAVRLLVWEAAWAIDGKKDDASQKAYLSYCAASDMAMMVTDRAVQILGGHGYIREHPVEMWMREGRGFASFTGLAMV